MTNGYPCKWVVLYLIRMSSINVFIVTGMLTTLIVASIQDESAVTTLCAAWEISPLEGGGHALTPSDAGILWLRVKLRRSRLSYLS